MERLHIYEQLRKGDPSGEPKESYPIFGFVAGPLTITTTKETLLWCRWPYEDHPRGCTNCGKKIEGCPGGKDSNFFLKEFNSEAYLLGVAADFGAYLKSRERQQHELGNDFSKLIKNKRWYQGTMNSWRSKWFKMVQTEFPDLPVSGWSNNVDNPEARGVDFGKVCRDTGIEVVRIKSESDYKIIKPTFSTSPNLTFTGLGSLKGLFIVENYYVPSVSDVLDNFDQGGNFPMWRLALVAKKNPPTSTALHKLQTNLRTEG
jgi:hypothetical protein